MGAALAIAYLVGCIATVGVGRYRAGLTQRGRLSAMTILTSLPWFLTQMGCMFVWPAVLGIWLARGRPESPWQAITTLEGYIRIRRRAVN